mmetsp:Transcript_1015/g.3826  ORF Transcript_1015/g.3826 Transcript_1015/m.3826 type:complete len:229 (-) Transcript_1015:1219-1905(-)
MARAGQRGEEGARTLQVRRDRQPGGGHQNPDRGREEGRVRGGRRGREGRQPLRVPGPLRRQRRAHLHHHRRALHHVRQQSPITRLAKLRSVITIRNLVPPRSTLATRFAGARRAEQVPGHNSQDQPPAERKVQPHVRHAVFHVPSLEPAARPPPAHDRRGFTLLYSRRVLSLPRLRLRRRLHVLEVRHLSLRFLPGDLASALKLVPVALRSVLRVIVPNLAHDVLQSL